MQAYPTGDTPGDDADRSAFAAVPLWLLNSGVSDRAIRLYAVLQTYLRGTTGEAFPTRQTLADRLGKSTDTVDRAARELIAVGAVVVTHRWTEAGDPTSNGYAVFFDSPSQAARRGPAAAKPRTGGREYAETGGRENAAQNQTHLEPDPPNQTREAPLFDAAAAADESRARFEDHFWPAYPSRNGKKLDKAKALAQWVKLSLDEQRCALRGARHYAASGQIPKDAHRWLRDRCWEDWQTPAEPDRRNGARAGIEDRSSAIAAEAVRLHGAGR